MIHASSFTSVVEVRKCKGEKVQKVYETAGNVQKCRKCTKVQKVYKSAESVQKCTKVQKVKCYLETL